MIKVTAAAIEEIKKFIDADITKAVNSLEGKVSKSFLRFGLRSGGCSGYTYVFAIEDTMTPDDVVVFEENDFKVVSDKHVLPFVDNSEIDFKRTLTEAGIVVSNPNAKGSCGCGQSINCGDAQ